MGNYKVGAYLSNQIRQPPLDTQVLDWKEVAVLSEEE